jgi:hypothetical protein
MHKIYVPTSQRKKLYDHYKCQLINVFGEIQYLVFTVKVIQNI